LDAFPEETSWEILNAQNEVLESGSGYTAGSESIVDSFCLPEGCYRFRISDSGNDGICCTYGQGGYELKDSASVVLAVGSQFTDQQIVDFCLGSGGSGCSSALNLTGELTLSSYSAADTLRASGMVPQEGAVTLQAGKAVILQPGFATSQGATLSVVIDSCQTGGQGSRKERSTETEFSNPASVVSEEWGAIPQIRIYPNPARDMLNVILTGTSEESTGAWWITDLAGSRIAFGELADVMKDGSAFSIDISSLPQGMYFLCLTNTDGQYCERFVVME
jgi:hypothetical protein